MTFVVRVEIDLLKHFFSNRAPARAALNQRRLDKSVVTLFFSLSLEHSVKLFVFVLDNYH